MKKTISKLIAISFLFLSPLAQAKTQSSNTDKCIKAFKLFRESDQSIGAQRVLNEFKKRMNLDQNLEKSQSELKEFEDRTNKSAEVFIERCLRLN